MNEPLVQIESVYRRQNKGSSQIRFLRGGREKKHCRKRKNADYQNFLLFPKCF